MKFWWRSGAIACIIAALTEEITFEHFPHERASRRPMVDVRGKSRQLCRQMMRVSLVFADGTQRETIDEKLTEYVGVCVCVCVCIWNLFETSPNRISATKEARVYTALKRIGRIGRCISTIRVYLFR